MPMLQLRLVNAVAGCGNVAKSRPLKTAETNNTIAVANSHPISLRKTASNPAIRARALKRRVNLPSVEMPFKVTDPADVNAFTHGRNDPTTTATAATTTTQVPGEIRAGRTALF